MHEEELAEKLARQFELNAQLDLENEKVADADLGGLEEEKSMNVAETQVPYETRNDKKDNGCPAKWRGIFAGGMLYEQKEGNYRTFNCGGCTVLCHTDCLSLYRE